MKRALSLALIVVALSCARSLDLPAPPSVHPPKVDAVEPRAAFAGSTITLIGSGFGTDASDVQVEFSGALPVAAKTVADGRLTVTVPLDAKDGLVAVRTSHGRASSREAFLMKGRGTLVEPGVAAQVDLQPRIDTALEVGGRLVVLASEPYFRAAIQRGAFEALPGTALWIGAHGSDVVELLYDVDAGACAADLAFVSPDQPAQELSPLRLRDEGDYCRPPSSFVVADDAVFVRSGQTLFVVDAVEGTVTKLAADLDPGRNAEGKPKDAAEVDSGLTYALAAIDGTRVLAASPKGLWDVRKTAGTWTATLVPLPLKLVSIALSHGRGIGLTHEGALVPLTIGDADIGVGAPRPLSSLAGVRSGHLAFSADGQRLAISAPERKRLFVYDVSSEEPVALGSVAVSAPRDVRSVSGGRWLVGAEGGVLTVSDRTGNLVDVTEVGARPLPPTLRLAEMEDDGELHERVEIYSRTFDRLRRFDAGTLVEESYYTFPIDPGPQVEEIACAPGGRDLVLRHGPRELRRIGDDPDVGEMNHPSFQAPEEWDEITAIAVSGDGAEVLVTHADADGTTRLTLLPMDDSWNTLTPTSIDPGLDEPFRVLAEGDRLAVVGQTGCALFNRTAAREGRLVPVGAPLPFPDGYTPLSAALADGRLLVFTIDGDTGYWRGAHVLSLEDGAPVGTPFDDVEVENTWDETLALSPSGRAFWWRAGLDESLLGEGTFDLATGTPAFRRALVRLSPGAQHLLPDPRGERLWVLDPKNDQLQLVQ